MRAPIAVILTAAWVTLGACSGSDEPPTCDDPVATTNVDMADFSYTPACVEAANGDTLTISNSGEAPHTFTVRDTEVELSVEPGSSGELTVEGLTSGTTYAVICTLHSNMTAALRVT